MVNKEKSDKDWLPSAEEVKKIAGWLDGIRVMKRRKLAENCESVDESVDLDEIDVTDELGEGALAEGERIVLGWWPMETRDAKDSEAPTHRLTIDWCGSDNTFKANMSIDFRGAPQYKEPSFEEGHEQFTGEVRNFNLECWELLKGIFENSSQ